MHPCVVGPLRSPTVCGPGFDGLPEVRRQVLQVVAIPILHVLDHGLGDDGHVPDLDQLLGERVDVLIGRDPEARFREGLSDLDGSLGPSNVVTDLQVSGLA